MAAMHSQGPWRLYGLLPCSNTMQRVIGLGIFLSSADQCSLVLCFYIHFLQVDD